MWLPSLLYFLPSLHQILQIGGNIWGDSNYICMCVYVPVCAYVFISLLLYFSLYVWKEREREGEI